MAKFWSILFGVVMLACGLSFALAPVFGWWLPEGVSTHAWSVDALFYFILAVTTFFFILTQVILVYFMWVYAGDGTKKRPVTGAVQGFAKYIPEYFHHAHHIEIGWSVVPAIILLVIAFSQIGAWADIKYQKRAPNFGSDDVPLQVAVSARQFEWRMRYPTQDRLASWLDKKNQNNKEVQQDFNSFGLNAQASDVRDLPNELHVWKGGRVLVHLTTRDVLHSFNLPHFRVKQDALPGKSIQVWFTPTKANTRQDPKTPGKWLHGVDQDGKADSHLGYDIPCAELCGWGHYRMVGRVYVHKDKQDFDEWLKVAQAYSHQRDGDR